MAIHLTEESGSKIIVAQVSGTLAKADFEHFVPEFERLVRDRGKLRILFDMISFHGWEAGAVRDEINFDLDHFSDIERLAMVGDKAWEHAMAILCKPFTTAEVRYFDHAQTAEARKWLGET